MADSETFVSVAGANLKAHGLDAAFFNAGVSGGAPPRYIALADYYKKLINPDAVVISLNDSDYTVDYLDKTHIFAALKDKDSYKMVKLGKNSKQKLMASPIASKLLRSSLVQIAAKKLSVGERRGGDGEAPKAKSETPRDEIDRYIRWTVAQFKAAYPNLVLAYVPKIDYFQPEKEPPMLEQLLENACKDEGVTLINMRKRYQTYFRETGQPCHGFPNTSPGKGHINAIGHQLLADEVSHELERRYSAG